MLKEERQQIILDEVKKSSKVLSSDLSKTMCVSEDTIRRDLKDLSNQGLIRKVHGGAILNETSSYIPMKYDDRQNFASEEKKVIAKKAVSLIKEEMLIFIDGGTTNLEIVRNIPDNLKIKIITNCLPVASELVNRNNIKTFFLGGEILKGVPVTVGADTLSLLDEINADLFFIGTRSINIKNGLTDIDRVEVLIKRKMADRSAKVVSVAHSEKLNSVQSFNIIPIQKLDILITELEPTDNIFADYKLQSGLTIL